KALLTSLRFRPLRFWMRPINSVCSPSTYRRSSSVHWAHFFLSLPLATFQFPFISSAFIRLSYLLAPVFALPPQTVACFSCRGDAKPWSGPIQVIIRSGGGHLGQNR